MNQPMTNRRRSIEQVYQLDVRLAYIDPPIWRRILVSDQILLPGLHHLLQVVMGWEHSHLYQFIVGTTRYGEPDPEFEDSMQSDRRVRLRDIAAAKGASLLYEYDFGDGWRHLITVEDLWPRTEYDIVPRCLDGARACPPEDAGGIGGYEHLLNVLRNKRDPEYKELRAWAGAHFDPACFCVQTVNSALALLVALGVTD
jgi:Plasmid pRiA4b ORF-3-like protein